MGQARTINPYKPGSRNYERVQKEIRSAQASTPKTTSTISSSTKTYSRPPTTTTYTGVDKSGQTISTTNIKDLDTSKGYKWTQKADPSKPVKKVTPTGSALEIFDQTTQTSKGFLGKEGKLYDTEQQALESQSYYVPTTTQAQRAKQIEDAYAKSGLDPKQVLESSQKDGYLEVNIPRSGFRYDTSLNKQILDKQATGQQLTTEEKEYLLQYSGAGPTPTRTPETRDKPLTKQESMELREEIDREAQQARLEETSKELGVAEAVRDEPKKSVRDLEEQSDKARKAQDLLKNMSLSGRVGEINMALAGSAANIKEKTLASKAKIGSEIEELIRQQSGLVTAVTVPDGSFFYPELMSQQEKQYAFGTDKFFLERNKALLNQQEEYGRFVFEQQVGDVLDTGNILGELTRGIRTSESIGGDLGFLEQEYGLNLSNNLLGVDSIPSTIVGSRRETLEGDLDRIAKNYFGNEEKLLASARKARQKGVRLDVPTEKDLEVVSRKGFFGGLTRELEGFREEIAPLGKTKSIDTSNIKGISLSPAWEKKAMEIRDKTLLKDFGSDPGLTRFLTSMSIGVTRSGELVEKLVREDVSLAKARLAGKSLSEKDLEVLSPTITGFRRLGEGLVSEPIGTTALVGTGIVSKIRADPTGELGEIIGPSVFLGGLKAGTSLAKSALGIKAKGLTELQRIAQVSDPRYLRSSKPFVDSIDDASRIGYSRLEAGTRKFLSVGDKTDDALAIASKKINKAVKQNIDDLVKLKSRGVGFDRKDYLARIKKEILSEKPPVSKTPKELATPNLRVVSADKGVRLKQALLDRRARDLKLSNIQKDVGKSLVDEKGLEYSKVLEKLSRSKAEQAIANKIRQAQLEKTWRTQLASQKSLVEKELLKRDIEILKGIQSKQFDKIIKDLWGDKGKGLPGVSVSKPKPPSPPSPPASATSLVKVPQKDGTILLQKMGTDSKKVLDVITKQQARTTSDLSKIISGVSKETQKVFPRIKELPKARIIEKGPSVQGVYGFTLPGIQKVSDSIKTRFSGLKEEETELIQIARNIGVGEIPSETSFVKYQEPSIRKTIDYTPSMVDQKLQENLNERLVERGLRDLKDVSRGLSLTKTKEDTRLIEKIGLGEKALLKELTDVKSRTDTRTRQDLRQVTDTSIRQDVKRKQAIAQLLKTRVKTMQDMKTRVTPKVIPKQFVQTRTRPQYTPIQTKPLPEKKPIPKIIPFGLDTEEKDKKKLQKLFKFYEIRGQPRGGKTTKKLIGTYPLIKGLNIGAKLVGKTPSRTIQYTPTKLKARIKDDEKFKFAEQFRRPGKTTRLTGSPGSRFLIEKSKFAIDAPREKTGITAKGIKARQTMGKLNLKKLGFNNRRVKNVRKKKKSRK